MNFDVGGDIVLDDIHSRATQGFVNYPSLSVNSNSAVMLWNHSITSG